MNEYEVTRTDTYTLTVEADSLEEAKQKVEEEDKYLNDGSYCGSDFEFDEDETPNEEKGFKVVILENDQVRIHTVPEEFEDDVEEWLFGEEHLNLTQGDVQWMTYNGLKIKRSLQ